MISSQSLRGQGNAGQRRDLSKRLDDFKNFIVSLIIYFNYFETICI